MIRRVALLAVALVALLPAAARANGDPASDTLLYADAYYPYPPNEVAKPLRTALDGMLKATRAKGYRVKLAIIAASADLGAYPNLFTQPQPYADLLTKEIAFNGKPRVLVVLPGGIGGNNLGDDAGPALQGVAPPANATADDLARTAMTAVGKLAAANGTPVAVPDVTVSEKARAQASKGRTSPLVYVLPVLVVAIAAGAAAVRGRGREDEAGDPDPE